MKEFLESAKAFSIPYEAWYSETSVKPYEPPCIMVGFYYENDGTEGEFSIEWHNAGIKLVAFNDSWEAFSKMPELIKLMADLDKKRQTPTINEFAKMLKLLGYKDITERVRKNGGKTE